MGHIVDAITKIALGWPDVQFKLTHNEKLVKHWPATGDPVDRIADVLGIDIKDDLCNIKLSADDLTITGWISSARNTRKTSRGIHLYVNGRVVRDRIVQHALFEGYSGRLIKGQFPLAVLFIHVPYDQVDVNVHPAKHEVRFAHQKNVHEAVKRAVSEALQHADRSGWNGPRTQPNQPTVKQSGIFEPMAEFKIFERQRKDPLSSEMRTPVSFRPAFSLNKDPSLARTTVQTPLWEKKQFEDLRVIGQFRDTYILCESGDGLILIDQHAAHERVLFEQLKHRFQDERKASQKLLIPETIDLGYREAKILERLISNLNELGLEIAPFGGDTFVVKAVPLLLKNKEIKPLVIDIVEKIAQIGFSSGMETVLDQCLELMACHGAIRANQRLSDKEIEKLLHQLDACDQPSNCPHGRPTWIRWSVKDLEKLFKRIV
jgi:DNA mismatch repair protein MutL